MRLWYIVILLGACLLVLGALCLSVNFPTIVTAFGTVTLTIATASLVVVGFFDIRQSHEQIQKQIQDARMQFQETQRVQARPLLIPCGLRPTDAPAIWSATEHNVEVQNVGT